MSGYLNESAAKTESSEEKVLPGPGERLKKRRESLGLTLADVASYLNLRISIVEAIEKNDYKHIPKLVFARGYLRSYAKLLNLSGNEIIESFNKLEWPETKSDVPASPLKMGQQKKPPKKSYSFGPWLAILILILLFIAAGFWEPITQMLTANKATPTMKEPGASVAPAVLPEPKSSGERDTSSEDPSPLLPSLSELRHET